MACIQQSETDFCITFVRVTEMFSNAESMIISWFDLLCSSPEGGGGGESHMKGAGMLVGNFELDS